MVFNGIIDRDYVSELLITYSSNPHQGLLLVVMVKEKNQLQIMVYIFVLVLLHILLLHLFAKIITANWCCCISAILYIMYC